MTHSKTVSLRSVQKLVKTSAEKLDTELDGWHKKIDLSRFDINMPVDCIVGQLKLNTDDMDESRGYHLNLDTCVMDKGKTIVEPYTFTGDKELSGNKLLTRIWKHQINQRLKQDKKREIVNKIMELLNF